VRTFTSSGRLRVLDQHGAVLPLAMVSLLVLSAVLLALSLLTGQEPLAARNHTMIAQAQALAEAGVDRALWALSTPGAPDGIAWEAPIPAPYDGSRLIGVAVDGVPLGGFRVTISGTGDRQRQIVATGLVPGDSGPIGRARQDISATAVRLRFPSPSAPIMVRGDLEIGSGVTVDASQDASCGSRPGTWSTGATSLSAGSQVRGRGGDPAIPNGEADIRQRQEPGVFDELTFDPAELSALKALARARGTYYQGHVSFDAARPAPDGLVFVDTASGQPISAATSDTDLASVTLGTGASSHSSGVVRGWIIVNGSLSIEGDVTLEGLVFAADRFSQTGTAQVLGAAMAGHVRSIAPSRVEALPTTGPALAWRCETGRTGAGAIPQRWIVKPGTYREAAG
jgi:hypothetical protein